MTDVAGADTSWREALTTKLGPLPAWVWGVGLGAVAAAYLAWRRRQTAAVADPELEGEGGEPEADGVGSSELVTGTASGYGDFTLSPSPMGGGSWAVAPAPVPTPGDPTDEDDELLTNQQWRQRASTWLVAELNITPILVNDALTKWFDGTAVNAQEEAVINQAVRQFGPPPQGAPTVIRVPAPVVTPPPTTPKPPPTTPTTVPPSAVTVPGAVVNLKAAASTVKKGMVRVTWAAPRTNGGSPITGYRVAVYVGPGNNWREVTPNDSWYADITGLPSGVKTTVRVAAVNAKGVGPYNTLTIQAN